MLWVEILMTWEMTVVKKMMKIITTMMVKTQRRRKMIILAIVGLTTSTLLWMRMASSVSYWRKCCGIWVSL
jgi:hypothetical protein